MSAPGDEVRFREPAVPIPIVILTGFLGAGKTTLLNRLLKDPALAQTAVIINEFGEIGLDHLLVEYVDDNVMLLQSGCLCCTMRGDLVDALETLLRDLDNGRCKFTRVILETTGLADPAPVLQTAMADRYLVMRYRLDGVIAVVDAVNGYASLDAHAEAVKQVAMADRLVLSKSDLASDSEALARLKGRLRALNPAAPILDAAKGEATVEQLTGCGLYDPDRKIADVKKWLAEEAYADAQAAHKHGHDHGHHDHGHHGDGHDGHRHHHGDPNRHDDHIRAFALTADTPIPVRTLDTFLALLISQYGPNLLRVKGIINLAESPDTPLVLHGVQHVLHPPARLERWPDDDRRSRLVFITKDLPEATIREIFNAFLTHAAPDRPDRAALTDNPLVPFGGADR
jgi:G3E family GTPase